MRFYVCRGVNAVKLFANVLYSTHDHPCVVSTIFSRVGPFFIMNIQYVFVIILLALGGILIGESIISSVNILEIILGAICLIIAVVLLIRTPVKR